MLARLLGFTLGNKNRFYLSKECMFTAQGPKCCVSRTLEGSPRYRSGSCAICTGPSSQCINVLGAGQCSNCDVLSKWYKNWIMGHGVWLTKVIFAHALMQLASYSGRPASWAIGKTDRT